MASLQSIVEIIQCTLAADRDLVAVYLYFGERRPPRHQRWTSR